MSSWMKERVFDSDLDRIASGISTALAKASAIEHVSESFIKSKRLIKSSPEANFTSQVVERQVVLRLSAS